MVNEIRRGIEQGRAVGQPNPAVGGRRRACDCAHPISETYARLPIRAAPAKPYTMTEARAQAIAERDACWTVIRRRASEVAAARGLTTEQAVSTVLAEDHGLFARYRELEDIDHRVNLTLRAMSEETARAETEAIIKQNEKEEAFNYEPTSEIDRKIHELALEIMEKHDIPYQSARQHAMDRNPGWRIELGMEYLAEVDRRREADAKTAREAVNEMDAEIGTAAVLFQAANPGTTYEMAYAEVMRTNVDLRRRLAEVRSKAA